MLSLRAGLAAIALTLATVVAGLAAPPRPADLRCECLVNPPAIDIPQPRLSWVIPPLEPPGRGLQQAAYQLQVASSAARLTSGQSDLWESGRIDTDQSVHVRYAGVPLASGQECHWRVRVWDEHGNESPWSEPARWAMGLLEPGDWRGSWIGKDEPVPPSALTGGNWIWYPEGNPAAAAPVGERFFRRLFEIPKKTVVQSARLLVAGDNEFTAFVNGRPVGRGASFQTASVFDVAGLLRPGTNVVAILVRNAGDAPNPAGLLARIEATSTTGQRAELVTDESWRVSRTAAERWERAEYNDGGWSQAKVLGPVGMAPWGPVNGPEDRRLPARYLRKDFVVGKPVRRATAHLSGLGLSELYLNGRKVGDHVLSPGLTEYTKRVFYVTHDVTEMVKRGRNCAGVILGNGRFFAPRVGVPATTRTYGFPKLLLQIEIEHTDGSKTQVVSDSSWRLTAEGPIRANNEYDGEDYDARKELRGWAEPGFDDSAWEHPQSVAPPGGRLVAQPMNPIRVVRVLPATSHREVSPGVWVYDFGQNFVGWCRLTVQGEAGTTISLRHAESVNSDGTLYLANLRDAKVTDTYTLRGGGEERYEPRFTYHGFRYVEISGYPGQPTLGALEGRVVNDDLETAGEWSCSNPMLDRILQNVRWGVQGNYRSLPTDCPQRDERQGWLGDRSQGSKGETFLFDTAALYAKWVQDMADAQQDNGAMPDVCPPYWPIYSDNVTWPASTVLIPGHLYTQYGDPASLERHYASMRKWMDHMMGFIQDDLMPRDTYGDWCVPPEDPKLIHSQDPARKTHPTILATSYYVHCLNLMTQYAGMLGQTDDAARYRALAVRLTSALNTRFYDAQGGYYDNGSQTSCVLPLALGLVPDAMQPRVFTQLVNQITSQSRNHIGTGLVGGQWLMRTLTVHGRADLAYSLAANRTYPSWGYMVDRGATTIWELWNGDTADPAMNSGNHVMLVGDLVIWMYECLAGIQSDPEHPGFKRILMKPHPVGDLTFVKATHRSPYGLISSEWRCDEGGRFVWRVAVPPNSTAMIHVPAGPNQQVTEGGKPIGSAEGLREVARQDGRVVIEATSGTYAFEVTR